MTLPRWLAHPWHTLRQADRVDALKTENARLRLECVLLNDREKNLKANLALTLSEANRLNGLLQQANATAQNHKRR